MMTVMMIFYALHKYFCSSDTRVSLLCLGSVYRSEIIVIWIFDYNLPFSPKH